MPLRTINQRPVRQKAFAAVALLSLVATTCIVMTPQPAEAASSSGTLLLEDSFRTSAVVSNKYKIGGRSFTPCLTASGTANSNPAIVPRQCGTTPDSSGSGALRLTDASNSRAGFLLYDHALPTKAGLDIEFRFYEYGGAGGVAGADGISFFLAKGTANLTDPGAYGGSLGYHFNPSQDGISNALLGVGFDAWGNFGVESNDSSCVAKTGITPPTSQTSNANTVGVRGPGDGRSGYCLLAQPKSYSGAIGVLGGTRATALRKARIVIDPPTDASPRVKVYVASGESGDVSNSTTPLVNVAEPAEFKTNPTFKFGWAASTGGSTNIHEINFLEVSSVNPILPELEITADNAPAAQVGQVTNAVIRPKVSSEGGPESKDVTVDLVPNGVQFGSTPTGTGWSCTPNGSDYRCVYAVSSILISGTVLPPITVPVTTPTSDQTGTFSGIKATVTSADNYYTTPKSATATASWRPVIGDSTGSGSASTAPTAITLSTPTISGSPITGYEIVSSPSAARGVASISTSGVPSFTPAAGASGKTTFTYRALGADGVQSLTNGTGTVTVKPVASPRTASTVVGTAVNMTLTQAPIGTGSLTYTVTQPATGGSATISSSTGAIAFTPTPGFSGVSNFTYSVRDGDGIWSDPASVAVNVAPSVAGTTLDITLDSSGAATGTTAAPVTTGSSPFEFLKATNPTSGDATVNNTTGAVTYTAASGVSGRFTTNYTASSDGVSSAAGTATITVRPYLSVVSGSGVAGSTVTLDPPQAIGSGKLAYSIGTPTKGSATIDAATGQITYDPQGHSGVVTVSYTVRDANGVDSTRTATITVAPSVAVLSATVAASPTPASKSLTAAPVGDGPWTYEIVTGLDPTLGAAVATSTGVAITPAAGVSGTLGVTYRVKGADDVWSADRSATLTVTPVISNTTIDVTLDEDGEASGAVTAPTPLGSGPFTFSRATDSSRGSVTVGSSDGEVSYSVTGGFSGVFSATYTATDAAGVTGNSATVTITVRPYLAAPTAETDADTPVVLDVSDAVGTPAAGHAGLQFTISTPANKGLATIGSDSGQIIFDPQGHSGTVTIGYTVTGSDGISTTRTATVTVRPTISALADAVVATGTPVATAMTAAPHGDGPFSYQIVVVPDASKGAAVATADGVAVTPRAGVSGVLTLTYRVKDAEGSWSNPARATLTVTPFAADGVRLMSSGTKQTVDFPTPVGVGPYHYELLGGLPAGWGTAKVTKSKGGQRLSLDIPATRSGQVQIAYKVTDVETLESQTASINIVVSPVAADLNMGLVRASNGGSSAIRMAAPKPSGSGPFRYEIASGLQTDKGVAAIHPTTGQITVTPRSGASGRFTFTYKVTDMASLVSNVATVTLLVSPTAAPVAASTAGHDVGVAGGGADATSRRTTGSAPLTITPTRPVGTGPFTYRIVTPPDPSHGTLVIDPNTGEMTFVAAEGFHGVAHYSYEVIDVDGLASEPQSVNVEVLAEHATRAGGSSGSARPRSLAVTGTNLGGAALAGAVLLLAGAAVVVLERRRTV